MVGYGPEDNHFVVELTYNYGAGWVERLARLPALGAAKLTDLSTTQLIHCPNRREELCSWQ